MNKFNLESLVTESVNLNTLNIDKLSTMDILKTINNEDKKVASAVEKEIPKIEMAIEKITEAFKNNGRLIYIGAGTSGRLGGFRCCRVFSNLWSFRRHDSRNYGWWKRCYV